MGVTTEDGFLSLSLWPVSPEDNQHPLSYPPVCFAFSQVFQDGYQHDGPFFMALCFVSQQKLARVHQHRPCPVLQHLHCPCIALLSLLTRNWNPLRISGTKQVFCCLMLKSACSWGWPELFLGDQALSYKSFHLQKEEAKDLYPHKDTHAVYLRLTAHLCLYISDL